MCRYVQLQRDPTNRAALAAARRCREKIESEAAVERSPIAGAIAKVREGSPEEKTNALKAIIALSHDDESAARVALRLGGVDLLWALRDVTDEVSVPVSLSVNLFEPCFLGLRTILSESTIPISNCHTRCECTVGGFHLLAHPPCRARSTRRRWL